MKKTFVFLCLCFLSNKIETKINSEQQSPDNPMRRQVFYAPSRETYNKLEPKKDKPVIKKNKCVFCADIESSEDEKKLLITRFEHNVVFLNLFPYQRGHILIIPNEHVADIKKLCLDARLELINIIAAVPEIFQQAFGATGTNIGINIGKTAGASKPDHLHIHAVPRFKNEHKGYMQLLAEARIVDWDMNKLYHELKPAFDELKKELNI